MTGIPGTGVPATFVWDGESRLRFRSDAYCIATYTYAADGKLRQIASIPNGC